MSRFDDRFSEFYLAEYPGLARYCRRLVGDDALAEDVAQEALVRVLSRWVTIRDPRAYSYLTATNLIRRHWRREQTDRRTVELLGQAAGTEVEIESDPAMRHAVETLPTRLRAPVVLHYYVGYPVGEVAGLLHRPVNTVKAQLSRARELLREQLLAG